MSLIVGRDPEKKILHTLYHSRDAELIAVYGRRRVGKTYLIKNFFQSQDGIYFHITGIKNGSLKTQLMRYIKIFSEVFYPHITLKTPNTWMEAFEILNNAIHQQPKHQKIVLFFDELPWLASRRSGILQALEYFWNQYWVNDERLKLIVCGSSSSWMLNKVIKNRGGLHHRVTRKLRMMPFTLSETQEFLQYQDIHLSQSQIAKLYMVMGGIPYYLKQLSKKYSIDQNISQLFFESDGLFFEEFNEVFFSLFDEAEPYKELIRLIAKAQSGLSRQEIEKKNKLTGKGGYLTKRLNDLEASGFIASYTPFQNKQRGTYYRIFDEYCYFYLKWIEPIKSHLKRDHNPHYWLNVIHTPAYHHWSGYAFENLCYKHITSIKKAIDIPLSSLSSPWRYSPKSSTDEGTQIDLVFQRPDQAITLCEIKYTEKPFSITKAYAKILENKISTFQDVTKTSQQIFMSLISAKGLRDNAYSEKLLQHVVTLEDFF